MSDRTRLRIAAAVGILTGIVAVLTWDGFRWPI